jgi:hypothetical protein
MSEVKQIINPTQDTYATFERDQAFANKLEQLSRVTATMDATPFTIKQALIYGFSEGGWRNGFALAPERLVRDSTKANKTALNLISRSGRRLRVTVEYVSD